MDASVRKPFQGVTNIVRFNWHLYLTSCVGTLLLFAISVMFPSGLGWVLNTSAMLVWLPVLISLAVSYYVYDCSGLYGLDWLKDLNIGSESNIVNINAGFDETSALLTRRYAHANLTVLDFYDPEKHTEVSIERARKAYEPYPYTQKISTSHIPLEDQSADLIFNIFSLHEIRDRHERMAFLKNQYTVLKAGGRCVVVEHLRDGANFMAYTIGFLHFFSKREWRSNFSSTGFHIEKVKKVTPFVSVFVLMKSYGDTP